MLRDVDAGLTSRLGVEADNDFCGLSARQRVLLGINDRVVLRRPIRMDDGQLDALAFLGSVLDATAVPIGHKVRGWVELPLCHLLCAGAEGFADCGAFLFSSS